MRPFFECIPIPGFKDGECGNCLFRMGQKCSFRDDVYGSDDVKTVFGAVDEDSEDGTTYKGGNGSPSSMIRLSGRPLAAGVVIRPVPSLVVTRVLPSLSIAIAVAVYRHCLRCLLLLPLRSIAIAFAIYRSCRRCLLLLPSLSIGLAISSITKAIAIVILLAPTRAIAIRTVAAIPTAIVRASSEGDGDGD